MICIKILVLPLKNHIPGPNKKLAIIILKSAKPAKAKAPKQAQNRKHAQPAKAQGKCILAKAFLCIPKPAQHAAAKDLLFHHPAQHAMANHASKSMINLASPFRQEFLMALNCALPAKVMQEFMAGHQAISF